MLAGIIIEGNNEIMDLNHSPFGQAPSNREYDEELVLTFLSHFNSLEQALVRAGYTQASHAPTTARADWGSFARHIEKQFDPDSSPVLQGAVAYLLCDPENRELRYERIGNSYPWENPDPHNDIVWLSELLQQTGARLLHELNFPGRPRCDLATISAAWFIVEAWSHLDPQVERLLSGL
jgi:hypothetical protein